jgi:hypothetical protein
LTPKPEIPRTRLLPGERAPWVAAIFAIVGLALVPWTLYLAVNLPARHVQQGGYDVAWVGFDIGLAALLTATAFAVLGRRVWLQGVAAATSLMLVVDAWFDVLSSNPGSERLQAILLAAFAELPAAGLCLALAFRAEAATAEALL